MTLISAISVRKDYDFHSLFRESTVKPVLKDISFSIDEGETVALLGRSGCGKSTLARLLVGLELPTSGEILFNGEGISRLPKADIKAFRRSIQLVFQDSPSAVNPRKTIREIIDEPLRYLTTLNEGERQTRIQHLLSVVELSSEVSNRLPEQLSGGQLQRVCIARALAVEPKLLILDEAVSNLDTHLQASALTLLERLQRQNGIAYLFITHDIRLVKRFASRCLVMSEGTIVEEVLRAELFKMTHPAARELLNATLPPLPTKGSRIIPAPLAGYLS